MKWLACRDAAAPTRWWYAIADEGEPGTFKGPVLLNRHADLVFEGMTLAAWATGARDGLFHLRGEYVWLRPQLSLLRSPRAGPPACAGSGILGQTGFDFDIAIHLGAGAYVWRRGERAARIARGQARHAADPPAVPGHPWLPRPSHCGGTTSRRWAKTPPHRARWRCGLRGYRHRPVCRHQAVRQSQATGAGRVYEYPFRVSVQQVLDDRSAADAGGCRWRRIGRDGGAITSSSAASPSEDVPSAQGLRVIVRFGAATSSRWRATSVFFAHESCGFCTSCRRLSAPHLKGYMDKCRRGATERCRTFADIDRSTACSRTPATAGLGRARRNPVVDTLLKFRPAYERRIQHADFQPAFDLDGALARARQMTGRDDAGAHFDTGMGATR